MYIYWSASVCSRSRIVSFLSSFCCKTPDICFLGPLPVILDVSLVSRLVLLPQDLQRDVAVREGHFSASIFFPRPYFSSSSWSWDLLLVGGRADLTTMFGGEMREYLLLPVKIGSLCISWGLYYHPVPLQTWLLFHHEPRKFLEKNCCKYIPNLCFNDKGLTTGFGSFIFQQGGCCVNKAFQKFYMCFSSSCYLKGTVISCNSLTILQTRQQQLFGAFTSQSEPVWDWGSLRVVLDGPAWPGVKAGLVFAPFKCAVSPDATGDAKIKLVQPKWLTLCTCCSEPLEGAPWGGFMGLKSQSFSA